MKKILTCLFVSVLIFAGISQVKAMTFEDGYAVCDKKPVLVLLYANWADNYQNYINAFRGMQSQFGDVYNFVELDIAKPDAKFFNSKYHIYPNLPYVLMFRDGGKISRYVQRDCVIDDSCFSSRIKSFIQ